jgi:putative DNA primase/helicase
MKTMDAARGKWRGILMALGVEENFLARNKHGPCPICGGRDRFRFDDKGGNGGFICNQCGAGNGMDLLMKVKGLTFPEAARLVDGVVGNAPVEDIKPERDEADCRRRMNDLWCAASPIVDGDMVSGYLALRGIYPEAFPSCLRFHRDCYRPDGLYGPAMLALVRGADNTPVNIHRTFLGPKGKAEMENPRALMPGQHPNGSAVCLSPFTGGLIGIAEGIETALAASQRFGVPVWAALNAQRLAGWIPPEGATSVVVFGDCDGSYTGQAAAFSLAHRIKVQMRLPVEVRIPNTMGKDWADADAA